MKINFTYRLFVFLAAFLCFVMTLQGQEKVNFLQLEKAFSGSSQVLEDEYGYTWISFDDGLYKYDGKDFSFVPYESIFGAHFSSDRGFKFSKDI